MDILKIANDWAKAELISTPFFVLAGIVFIILGLGFWQIGKTDLAKAYIIPAMVAGTLLVIIGLGLYFTNKSRITQFNNSYQENPVAFIDSELTRTHNTLKEYKNVVFTGIPIIIAVCAFILIFAKAPLLRASMISIIAMLAVILIIDGLAHARINKYNQQLLKAKQEYNS